MMPMKVTVCFDRVRVIVPCGDGEILVKNLVEKAIVRYKKATGKSNDHWVSVSSLRTINDGGILDPDDQLSDVVDDREQLIADYEEQGGQTYQPHNGDGASQSSAGTASPDIFQGVDNNHHGNKNFSAYRQDDEHDVIVTPRDLEGAGPGLTVRRGSEPVLNILDENQNNKTGHNHNHLQDSLDADDHEVAKEMDPDGDHTKGPFSRFSRDSWRQSLGNRPDMYKWLEAQERQTEKIHQMERRDPVGGSSTEQSSNNDTVQKSDTKSPVGILINLPNDGGPLGIHVVPDYNENGREMGLLVQGVEDGGRVAKDGRLRENDRIIEINGQTLVDVSFSRAQDIFRSAMKREEIKLRIVKKQVPPIPKHPPPPVMPKPRHTPLKPSPLTLSTNRLDTSDSLSPTGPDGTSTPAQNSSSSSIEGPPLRSTQPSHPLSPPSPTKRAPPAVPARHPSTTLSSEKTENSDKEDNSGSTGKQKLVAPTNTKKIGKKIEIVLTKGPVGLGFSVTTRDNPAGGDSPIYIKNIMSRGAAITDGRLKAGDRLLEVNEEDLSGQTQSDVVAMLRNMPMGSSVKLVISRQETVDSRFQVPRALKDSVSNPPVLQPAEKAGDDGSLANMKNKEIIRLKIPLNDSGSAGLGVSVKGKTLTTDQVTKDLGIFIKSVIHGGAASKDGSLVVNDQLVEVNGEILSGLSNTDAMETLRKAMQSDGPIPGHIQLVIARKIGAPSPSPFQQGDNSDMFSFSQNSDSKNQNGNENKEIFFGGDSMKGVKDDPAPPPRPHRQNDQDVMDGMKARNFLIERLTGDSALRNDSYTRATHESFNDSAISTTEELGGMRNMSYNMALGSKGNILSPGVSPFKPPSQSSPTVNPSSGDGMMIEEDRQQERPRVRPHSTIGFLHRSLSHSNSSSSEDLNQQPVWLQDVDWGQRQSITSAELSPISPEPVGDFRREAFGRQSMSEKRKGHIDPSRSEFYQRVKNQREKGRSRAGSNLVRVGSAESIISRNSKGFTKLPPLPKHGKRIEPNIDPPPATNLKRFNSLENLAQPQPSADSSKESLSNESLDMDEGQPERPTRLGRGRGCNDSFRAAVDRSYDPAPTAELTTMDTLEEESSESGSLGQPGFHNNSTRSSISSDNTTEDNMKKKVQKSKEKKSSIFKGLIKFGKGKKASEVNLPSKGSSSKRSDIPKPDQEDDERIQEEMRQLEERHKEAERLRIHNEVYPPPPSHPPPHPHELRSLEQHSAPQLHPYPQGPRSRIQQYTGQQQYHSALPTNYHEGSTQWRSFDTHDIQRGGSSQWGVPERGGSSQWGAPEREDSSQWSEKGGGNYSNLPHVPARHIEPLENPGDMTRAEWIQQLRAKHQQRHRERQGLYPQEDREERYEREIQKDEERVGFYSSQQGGSYLPGGVYQQDPPYNHRYGKSAIPENLLTSDVSKFRGPSQHGNLHHEDPPPQVSQGNVQPPRPHSTNPVSYDSSRPRSRPTYTEPPPSHHYPHIGHVIHPRQHSNEIMLPRQHNMDHYHQRQSSDISEQYSQDYSVRRPPSRGRSVERWIDPMGRSEGRWVESTDYHQGDMYAANHRHSPYLDNTSGNYGNRYREPGSQIIPGKRAVQSITQPGSAKV